MTGRALLVVAALGAVHLPKDLLDQRQPIGNVRAAGMWMNTSNR